MDEIDRNKIRKVMLRKASRAFDALTPEEKGIFAREKEMWRLVWPEDVEPKTEKKDYTHPFEVKHGW